MNHPLRDDVADSIEAGTQDADRETARKLGMCGPVARACWAALATMMRAEAPIDALWERGCGTEEQVRAAMTELHALRLIGFSEDSNWVSHCGVWLDAVSRVLGADPGHAIYPRWNIPSKWLLVSQSEMFHERR